MTQAPKQEKKIRIKVTPESKPFWDAVKKAAEEVKTWPKWKRGISPF